MKKGKLSFYPNDDDDGLVPEKGCEKKITNFPLNTKTRDDFFFRN